MDIDWTFPFYPDPALDMNQELAYTNFLEEQDAMDTMSWADVPILSIEPRPDSEDATGLETDSIMDLGCVCDFPPLSCKQHGVYGNFSVDNDLPLPSFDLEPSKPTKKQFELSEVNPTGQSLSPGSFEMGHASPSMPSNDQTHAYTANNSRDPIKPLEKQLSRRSNISSKNRTILSAYFSNNRYPGTRDINELQERTGLDKKCVKTWFSNARHRTAHNGFPVAPLPQESRERSVSETPLQASTSVSAESLRKLDRVSPARSTTSLERYLATPLTDEAITSAAVESLSETCSTMLPSPTREEHETAVRRLLKRIRTQQAQIASLEAEQRRTNIAGSVAGSDSSIDSGTSVRSWISQNSVDSRGPRRGRKNWVQDPNHFNATESTPETKGKSSATTENPKKRPWYCTWPTCDKSFRFRYEWDRHEVAVHHWPYHWVCNLDQENDTVHKDAASRIFYRDDQLLAHMRGSHPVFNVTKASVATLKQDNPDFNPESLKCGFCHESLRNWEERQNHVAAHIKGGLLQDRLPKSSWLVTQG